MDVAVPAAIAVAAAVELAVNPQIAPRAVAAPMTALMAAALLWWRRAPVLTLVVVLAASVVQGAAGVPIQQPVVPMLAQLIATYAVFSRCGLRRAAVGGVLLVGGLALQVFPRAGGVGNFVFGLVLVGGVWLVAQIVRRRTTELGDQQRRADHLERHQDVRAREVAREERVRIARELHDVIAHSVSVMVVQAGAAEQLIRRDPGRSQAAMQAVQHTGREALAELANLLGLLREDSAEIGMAPQPRLADLRNLVQRTRTAGLPVTLEVAGPVRPLPPGVELSLYRIVQEALTNVRKHAGNAQTSVTIRFGADSVHAEVRDDGSGRSPLGGIGGHGLVGMRERVTVHGGTLHAGPGPDGGYCVLATIPVRDVD